MTDMKITALAPWFGSKRTLAATIVSELGPHSSYFEPFCGSMAVLLQKPVSSHENVNDLHGDLINLARVIQHQQKGPALYRRLRRVALAEDAYKEARTHVTGDVPESSMPDVARAYWYFVFSWMGRNGTAGTPNINCGFCARWTPHGGHGGKRFHSAVNSIPAWRRRLRPVTILHRDGFDVLAKIEDCEGTAIYVDPPYLEKAGGYVHDFTGDDHKRLAYACQRFKVARVVVSYYDDPALDGLYPGWSKVNCYMSKATSLQNKRGAAATVAPEVLLVNGPAMTRPSEPLFGGGT